MKHLYLFIYPIIPIITIFLIIYQCLITNNFVGSGKQIDEIETNISILKDENELLSQQLAKLQSISFLEERAKIVGFIQPSAFIVVAPEQPVALR